MEWACRYSLLLRLFRPLKDIYLAAMKIVDAASKMVEFANKLQEKEGLFIRETIEKAAAIRLRPIFMTIADMVLERFLF